MTADTREIDLSEFAANVVVKKTEHGVTVRCRKGLWSVSAPDMTTALRESAHYYRQYREDGEYDDG